MEEVRDIFGSAPLTGLEYNLNIEQNPSRKDIRTAAELLDAFPLFEETVIYKTQAHLGIYDVLLAHCRNLSSGKYKGRRGECCSTLVGAKGIGKTSSLQIFTKICKFMIPNVHVVYVNFNNICSSGPKFLEFSLITLIMNQLRQLGLVVPEVGEEEAPKDVLLTYLQTADINVLVLIDELDQLYKTVLPVNEITLHDLACLGNQPTGRVSVVLCGSSAMMEDLITTNGVKDTNIVDEFPLLKGAPNLNSTKYITKRVYSALPTDLGAVATLTRKELNDANKPWLRVVAFAGGCSARATGRLLNDSGANGSILLGLSPDSALSGHNTLNKDDMNHLREEIIKGLYKKNNALFKQFFDSNGRALLLEIERVNWEEQFQPLLFAEVNSIWKKLINKKKVRKEDSGKLVYNLLYLSDRCWLTINGVVDNHPERIYPFSMFHLFKQHMKEDALTETSDQLMTYISQGASAAGKDLSDPKLLTGMAVTAGLSCVVM
mmetsp:Transcript_23372/g.31990  ORF Transcript_23372/g.31990 Transcript_23372/m.31990 type:complete len:490 (+) Transcript_23372:83-1552(+)